MQEISNEVAKSSWAKMIQSITKYYPSALVNTEQLIYEVIISPRKEWVFQILNRVYVNRDMLGQHMEVQHPYFAAHLTRKYEYRTEDVAYSIFTKPYLNGNTLCVIKLNAD